METISDSSGIRGSVESLIGGRAENQDSYGMAETRMGMLVVVCDGMGGGPAGKTASSIATQAIIDYVSGAAPDSNPISILEDAVVSANEAIMQAVAQNPGLKGMGTTCVCVLIGRNKAYVVHVGDSRCYQLRANRAVFRTSDHSYVGELVKRGTMSEEEARNSKYSNVITRAIGAGPEIQPEVDVVSYKPGDRFALMSDGIWGTMPEPALVEMLSEKDDPATLVPDIAAHVDALGKNGGGGHDNLTLALVDLPGAKPSVNDLHHTARKNMATPRSASARPVPASDEVEYELKEDKEHLDERSKRSGMLTWVFAGALLVAIAVIVYLLVWHTDNDLDTQAGKDSTPQTVQNIVDSRTSNAEEPTENIANPIQAQPQTHTSTSDVSKSKEQTLKPITDEKKSEPEAKTPDKAQQVGNAAIAGNIAKAKAKLEELRDYKPEIKNKEKLNKAEQDRLTKKRIAMADEAIKFLNTAKQGCTDNAMSEKIEKIINGMSNDKKTMSKFDTNNFVSRDDALKAIKKYISQIEALKLN